MKVAIIGTSRIGGATALCLANDERVTELLLINRTQSKAECLRMDLMGTFPNRGSIIKVVEITKASKSDIIIITGCALYADYGALVLEENRRYIKDIFRQMVPKKTANIIVIGSPPDKLAFITLQESKLDSKNVIGFGGQLDGNCLKYLIWNEQHKFPTEKECYFIGVHGERGISIIRAHVKNKELIGNQTKNFYTLFLSSHDSSLYGAASEIARLARALMVDEEMVMHVSYCNEKYGRFILWPCRISKTGISGPIPLELTADEKRLFEQLVNGE